MDKEEEREDCHRQERELPRGSLQDHRKRLVSRGDSFLPQPPEIWDYSFQTCWIYPCSSCQ